MNGTCAGGTGAFIDQDGASLKTDATGLVELAKRRQADLSTASRCGALLSPTFSQAVGCRSYDTQPPSSSANQTVSGLACVTLSAAVASRRPCSTSELRRRFYITLNPGRRAHCLATESLCCNGRCSGGRVHRPANHLYVQVKWRHWTTSRTSRAVTCLDPLFATQQ